MTQILTSDSLNKPLGALAVTNPTVPKTSGYGFKVDTDVPTFPWRDLEGALNFQSGVPGNLDVYRSPMRQYSFSVNDQLEARFHIPHDYLPGSDLYAHVHWSHIGTVISGTFTGTLQYTYAKGHNQAAFFALKTLTVSYATVNIATTPQYQHRIDEVQLSTPGGSASLLDTALIEPDGLILMNYIQTAIPAITGVIVEPFVHFVDIHYQSTGIGTKQKSPGFWT